MNQEKMNEIFNKVCQAWNEHDFDKKDKVITKSMTCKHSFNNYTVLGDNTKEYYCSHCGLCK